MIYYGKLLKLFEDNSITSYTLKKEKLIGQETYRKIKSGTGIYEEGYDTNGNKEKNENGNKKDKEPTKKLRINAIDTKAIEAICTKFNCQPSDIMEVIPNTWENAGRLCEVLSTKDHKCTPEELPDRVPMEEKDFNK